MEIQPFTKDQWHLGQTIIVDKVLWFKGKDVANSLEYASTRDALQKHVYPEDKLTFSELAKSAVDLDGLSNQQPHELYINESGLLFEVIFQADTAKYHNYGFDTKQRMRMLFSPAV